MTATRWTQWSTAGLLILLLLVVYVTLWRPARGVLTRQVALPVLTSLDTERARTYSIRGGGLSIQVRPANPSRAAASFRAPAGILFLLPALFLALFFPYRPYWLYFWGFHLMLGTLQLGTIAIGIAWADWGFALTGFLRAYVLQGLSLAAPVAALYISKARPPLDQ